MAAGDSLFCLTRLVSATDIKLSARCETGRKQILAFVTESGHLTLYYKPTPDQLPIMKIVPWFSDSVKRIAALTFDPSGTWLLVAGNDGTVHIVPALSLVDPSSPAARDHRWSTADVTSLPTPLSAPAAPSDRDCRVSRPTAVVWWQCGMECQHLAVVGTDRGDVAVVSLTGGGGGGRTRVGAAIARMHVCQDNSLDSVFLLITSDQGCQWKLLLEQRSSGYVWPLDNVNNKQSDFSSSQGSLELELSNRGGALPTTRSRLQGLKQLSVEKLASLRQRLAETRVKGAADRDVHTRRGSNSSSSDESLSRARKTSSGSEDPEWTSTGPAPERLNPYVGDTFLQPQYARGRYLLSGYYAPKSILTIHGMNLEVVPLFVHKLAPLSGGDVVVTDRFLFVTDERRRRVSVVACQLAEGRLDGDTEFNPESVVDAFDFADGERVISVFKRTDCIARRRSSRSKSSNSNHRSSSERREQTPSENGEKRSNARERSSERVLESGEKRSDGPTSRSRSSREREAKRPPQFVLPKDVRDLKIDEKPVDTCVVVTTAGIYEVILRRSAVEVFMDLVLKRQELEKAERLAHMFALDLQQLFEAAGDLKLADKLFPQAISLYKLSRCRHLRSVLKFAAAGHSKELLAYIGMLLSTAGVELAVSERIHLANLAVMAYTDQVLRAVAKPKVTLTKQFLEFLCCNLHYDEVLAVTIAGQTGLWSALGHLAGRRGLHPEVLEVLVKIIRSTRDEGDDEAGRPLDPGLWSCLSHPALLQSLLARPHLARTHASHVTRHLSRLDPPCLERLAALLDPTRPAMRPALRRLMAAARRRRHASAVSEDSSFAEDSVDAAAENEEMSAASPVEEMVQTFMLVLLHLTKARTQDPTFDIALMERVKPPSSEEDLITFMESNDSYHSVPLRTTLIGAGFCHVALVRNTSVYTWGNAVQGCLGTGPNMSRYCLPQHVSLFPTLKVEVLSVSCGRQHTLALTTNGVYSWGSSQFGQLGIGDVSQSSWPVLIEGLAKERIVAISAGQYHSLALTSDGRVYSWGWGVHGQLGHGSVEDCREPRVCRPLLGRTVVRVAAGHGHSAMLDADGHVLACGSSMFGQLGGGRGRAKSTRPVKVDGIPEPVVDVATNYFHNLALTATNRLYIWGASPQVLRLQAQAQKKARLMQQHCPTPSTPTTPAADPSPEKLAAEQTAETDAEKDARRKDVVESSADVADPPPTVTDIADVELKTSPDDVRLVDASRTELVINERTTEIKSNADAEPSDRTEKTTPIAKKSFTQSVHDYFMEHKISLSDVTQGGGQKSAVRKAVRENVGTEMATMRGRGEANVEEVPMFTNVRTASAEGYAIPTIVVSPTIDTKRVNVARKPATPAAPAVKKPPQKPPPYLLDDGGQTHTTPQMVDTSLVVGQIVQIACGCHHSALVTKDGTLYTWGRNMDGQLGTGGRREVVIPTALGAAQPTARGGSANPVTPSCDKLTVQQVVCGCEFTVALDNQSSKLWAWGSNSHAQLGKAPVEDGKCLDGRMVMIKTVKRVIKLPHGAQNSVDSPLEVPHLPTSSITFRPSPRSAPLPSLLSSLRDFETPSYGARTLHYVAQRLYGHYDATAITAACVDVGEYQAAAKLAWLGRQHDRALAHQLTALERARGDARRTAERDTKMNAENVSCVEARIADGVILVQSGVTVENLLRDTDLNENVVVGDLGNVERSLKSGLSNGGNAVVANGDGGLEDADTKRGDILVENVANETGIETDKTSQGNDEMTNVASSSVSTPDSVLSSPSEDTGEIHAFCVQGGNEEMSEERNDVTSPSDTMSSASGGLVLEADTLADGGTVSESTANQSVSVTLDQDNNCSYTATIDHCSIAASDSVEIEDAVIKVTDNLETLLISEPKTDLPAGSSSGDVKEMTEISGVKSDDEAIMEQTDEISAVNDDDEFASRGEAIIEQTNEISAVNDDDEFASRGEAIIEHYIRETEDEGCSMAMGVLRRAAEFWTSNGLPTERLEALLTRHIDRLFYPLGLMLFSSDEDTESPSLLNHLSTKFCLQLCSTLMSHINKNKSHPEYIELLANATSIRSDEFSSYPTNQTSTHTSEQLIGSYPANDSAIQTPEQLVEAILAKLGGSATIPYITLSEQVLTERLNEPPAAAARLFAFSCGHRFTSSELHGSVLPRLGERLPHTACAMRQLFEDGAADASHLACPQCVARHVQAVARETPI